MKLWMKQQALASNHELFWTDVEGRLVIDVLYRILVSSVSHSKFALPQYIQVSHFIPHVSSHTEQVCVFWALTPDAQYQNHTHP